MIGATNGWRHDGPALLALAQGSIEFHAPWVNGFIWTDKWVPLAPAHPAEMERPGWIVERMASDLAFALEHGCPYCGGVLIVGHPKRRPSFDIIDESIFPWRYANVVVCYCQCNSSKKNFTVAQWINRFPKLRWAVNDRRHQFVAP
jgi:hypothetical protein